MGRIVEICGMNVMVVKVVNVVNVPVASIVFRSISLSRPTFTASDIANRCLRDGPI
jgi:hypothetical protein